MKTRFSFLVLALSFLLSCNGSFRSDSADQELWNLKPLEQADTKDTAKESWDEDSRIAYAGHYYLLGEYLTQERNSRDAQNFLELANELDPNEFLAYKTLASKISAGKDEEALKDLERLTLLYPNSAQFQFIYGVLLSKAGNFDSAISHYEKAIKLEPTDEKSYLQVISIYEQKNEKKKAFQTIQDLVRTLPKSIQGQIFLARFLKSQGNIKGALNAAKQAYDANPTQTEIALFYAQILELSGDKNSANKIYEQCFNDNSSVEDLLSKTIALYKTFGDLNTIYKRLVEMGSRTSQKNMSIEIQKALVLWELGKNEEALTCLQSLQKINPHSEQVQYLIALAYEKLGNIEKALSVYESMDEESSLFIPGNFQSLRILESQNQMDHAYKVIQKLAQSRYAISEVFTTGANFYAKNEKYKEAIALLQEGYKKFSDDTQLIFLIGVFQEKLGLIDECIVSMREVIRKDPNYSPALNYLGYLWAERGVKLDLAKTLIERALSLKPNDGFYLDSLGWVYYQKGDMAKALEVLTSASRSQPDEGVILEHIGDVYLKMKRFDDAIQTYEQALKKINLESRDKQRMEIKLKNLKNT